MPEPAAVPKHVEIVDEIPMTAVGKPYKPELQRRAAEQAARQALAGLPPPASSAPRASTGGWRFRFPHSDTDAEVRETLSRYAWTWKLA